LAKENSNDWLNYLVEETKMRKLKPCKKDKCFQGVVLVPRDDKEAILRRDVIHNEEKISVDYPVESHPSGLCYFHLKTAQGFFTQKYPLNKR